MHCALLDQLGRMVSVLQRNCSHFRTARIARGGEAENSQDFRSLALSCAFLSFVEMGGDIDHPDAFDWETRWPELLNNTTRRLDRELTRGQSRRERLPIDRAPDTVTPRSQGLQMIDCVALGHVGNPQIELPPLDAMALEEHRATIQRVLDQLETRLSDRDWILLKQVYLEDQSPLDLAVRVYKISPVALYQRLSVARKRARAVLRPTLVQTLDDA